MQELYTKLTAILPEADILRDESMSLHTTFRVGGPADIMVFPSNAEQIVAVKKLCAAMDTPLLVIGNGSNLLVRDKGVRGVVMVVGEHMSEVRVEGTTVIAQAGASMARVASAALNAGLTGFEFASGIPGTLGGGCVMNAGAYGGQLSDVLVSAEVLFGNEVRTLTLEEMDMSYRDSMPLREGGLVLSATFALKKGDRETISQTMKELNGRRRDKQPLSYPSAGSTFKRPTGYFAGALIEQSRLKGYSIGGAQVSEKHAGFVINTGNATAGDILNLIAYVQDVVRANFGVSLETEVRIVGEA